MKTLKHALPIIAAALCAIPIYAGPISDAIESGNAAALVKLSDTGAKEDDMTPLFLATLSGSTELVKALLATKAGKESINATMTNPDFIGWTVLQAAAIQDSWLLLQLLWQAGARPQPGASELPENLISDESVKNSYMGLLQAK